MAFKYTGTERVSHLAGPPLGIKDTGVDVSIPPHDLMDTQIN